MTKSFLLLRLPWIILGSAILMVTGCESALKHFKPLPEENKPAKEQEPNVTVQTPLTAEMESLVHQRINQVRQQHHLNQLQVDERLARVARQHSRQMARQNFFSHTSPAGDTVVQRVRSAHVSYWVVGENLFKSVNILNPVPSSIQGWMNSPGHRQNILQPEFTQTGVGVWRNGNTYYITQVFLRPPPIPDSLFRDRSPGLERGY